MHTAVLCYHNATCLLLWALSKSFRRISLNITLATWRCGRKPPSGQNIQRWKEKENGLSGYSDGVTRSKTLLLCLLFVPECWRAIFSPQLFEWLRKRCRWCDEGTRNTQYVSSHWPPTLWKEDICTLSCTYLLWHLSYKTICSSLWQWFNINSFTKGWWVFPEEHICIYQQTLQENSPPCAIDKLSVGKTQ